MYILNKIQEIFKILNQTNICVTNVTTITPLLLNSRVYNILYTFNCTKDMKNLVTVVTYKKSSTY